MRKIVAMCEKKGRRSYEAFEGDQAEEEAGADDKGRKLSGKELALSMEALQKRALFTADLSEQYEVLRVLGKGAFGEVLETRVRDGVHVEEVPRSHKSFAMKVLKFKKGEESHLSSWEEFVAFTKSEVPS